MHQPLRRSPQGFTNGVISPTRYCKSRSGGKGARIWGASREHEEARLFVLDIVVGRDVLLQDALVSTSVREGGPELFPDSGGNLTNILKG